MAPVNPGAGSWGDCHASPGGRSAWSHVRCGKSSVLPAAFRRLSAAPAARTLPAGSCAPRPGPWFFGRLPLGEVATAEGRCPRSRRGGLDGEARRGPRAASQITGLRGQPGPRPLGEEHRAWGGAPRSRGGEVTVALGAGDRGGEEGSKWPSTCRGNIRAQGTGQSWPGGRVSTPLALPRLPGLRRARLPPAACHELLRRRPRGAADTGGRPSSPLESGP